MLTCFFWNGRFSWFLIFWCQYTGDYVWIFLTVTEISIWRISNLYLVARSKAWWDFVRWPLRRGNRPRCRCRRGRALCPGGWIPFRVPHFARCTPYRPTKTKQSANLNNIEKYIKNEKCVQGRATVTASPTFWMLRVIARVGTVSQIKKVEIFLF